MTYGLNKSDWKAFVATIIIGAIIILFAFHHIKQKLKAENKLDTRVEFINRK